MRFWWVNQKQTFRQEFSGGYMWSPKRNRNGRRNRAYESMRIVSPGDVVFSYAEGHIKAIGIINRPAYSFPKPDNFGAAGANWDQDGWRVDLHYQKLRMPFRPKDNIKDIVEVLPDQYSPLQANGNGNQTFYLYEISKNLAYRLAELIGEDVLAILKGNVGFEPLDYGNADSSNIDHWENQIERSILSSSMDETARETLILARRGQGRFRTELSKIEKACRVTGVTNKNHLVASHTKPWREATNEERIDPENGFLLTPNVDQLFDKGLISFEDSGDLIISEVADLNSLKRMGMPLDQRFNVGTFTEGQKKYLDWHREDFFLKSSL